MNSVALDPAYRRVSVEEFLQMDFGDAKAELEDGLIFMMTGGNEGHARIAANLVVALGSRLRGSGCRPYGSDLAVRTGSASVRFPDVSVYCRPLQPADATKQLLGDPQVVVEVLSPSTSSHDQVTKLAEYRALAGVREIVFVDATRERVRLVKRTGEESWSDECLPAGADLTLPSLNLSVPHGEIFAAD
jgi:Uma2 family endonuclease